MEDTLLEKLEQFKQIGHYQIIFYYGEGVGCDDSGVPVEDRSVVLISYPVGCIGETRCLYKGSVKSFLEFDFKATCPIKISNPPDKKEYDAGGYFIWGVDSTVDNYLRVRYPTPEPNEK